MRLLKYITSNKNKTGKVKNYNLKQWVYSISHTDTNLLSIRIGKVVELLFSEVGNIAISVA